MKKILTLSMNRLAAKKKEKMTIQYLVLFCCIIVNFCCGALMTIFDNCCCCCCCRAYLSFCHRRASDANLLDDPHTFHYQDYFVIGGIRTCLGVSDDVLVNFFEFLSTEFAACSEPLSRYNHRKAFYPRTQQRD